MTGFIVTLFFGLFTFACNSMLRGFRRVELWAFHDYLRPFVGGNDIHCSLSELVGSAIPSDPNVIPRGPTVSCHNRSFLSDVFFDYLYGSGDWIAGYDSVHGQGFRKPFSIRYQGLLLRATWHPRQGLVAIEAIEQEHEDEDVNSPVWEGLYVGPKGMSQERERQLGRFQSPHFIRLDREGLFFICDADLNTLYRVSIPEVEVSSFPLGDKSMAAFHRVALDKNKDLIPISLHQAMRWETDAEMKARYQAQAEWEKEAMAVPEMMMYGDPSLWYGAASTSQPEDPNKTEKERNQVYLEDPKITLGSPRFGAWIVDDRGKIYFVDSEGSESLPLGRPQGHLPRCGTPATNDPAQLLAYNAAMVYVDETYLGLAVVALAKDASECVLALFDTKGTQITENRVSYREEEIFHYMPFTSMGTLVLDCLQPLGVSMASTLLGSRIEALTSYRTLFVQPFAPALLRRDADMKLRDRYGTLVMWNVLTWSFGLCLGTVVIKDLRRLGCSRKAEYPWLVACMVFGLIAYVTYILTRPGIRMVTCANCGHTRRPDQAVCHHCRADWEMDDLAIPAWRVVDSGINA